MFVFNAFWHYTADIIHCVLHLRPQYLLYFLSICSVNVDKSTFSQVSGGLMHFSPLFDPPGIEVATSAAINRVCVCVLLHHDMIYSLDI